ncbi:MAG: hypothetical protein OXI88_22945 [Gammaproteobacteria bacterium]|nr:hypothetical protein [Gammaproteobacteria bacterium]
MIKIENGRIYLFGCLLFIQHFRVLFFNYTYVSMWHQFKRKALPWLAIFAIPTAFAFAVAYPEIPPLWIIAGCILLFGCAVEFYFECIRPLFFPKRNKNRQNLLP